MSSPGYQTIRKMAADYISCSVALNSRVLDLSRRQLDDFPSPGNELGNIECLYLEGNSLADVPEHLLARFKSLKYLDLRNNRLKHLPPAVGRLKTLKTLLLSGNQLQVLPVELGSLPHLSSLSLTDNPLVSPPQHVVRQGTKAVLAYLRARWQEETESDSDTTGDQQARHVLQHIAPSKTQVVGTGSCIGKSPQKPQAQCAPPLGLPAPLLQQALVHRHHPTTSTHRRQTYSLSPSAQSHTSPVQGRRRRRMRKGGSTGGMGEGRGHEATGQPEPHVKVPSGLPHEVGSVTQAKIAAVIEKQKSQSYLESWRQEAKTMQRQLQREAGRGNTVIYTRAAELAPFGTDLQSGRPPLKQQSDPPGNPTERDQPSVVDQRWDPSSGAAPSSHGGTLYRSSGQVRSHSPSAAPWGRTNRSDSDGENWTSPDAEMATKRGHEYRLRAFLPTVTRSPKRKGL